MKAVFHVVEYDKWEDTLSNARDVLNQDSEAILEIICMSKSAMLFERYSGVDFHGLLGNPKVTFVIGETALRENNLDKNLLPPEIKVEKDAISRIIRRQNEGYAYIRL